MTQVAKIDFVYTGLSPSEAARTLLTATNIDEGGIRYANNVVPLVRRNYSRDEIQRHTGEFKERVKAFRRGDDNKVEITFPLRFGMMSYMDVIPTRNYINILFRHDSCVAHNYNSESGRKRTHHQPQVYVLVKVNTETNDRSYHIVNSRLAVGGRVFPHNSASREQMTSGCCDGDYNQQIRDALRQDDFKAFLSLMSMYITEGTRSNDDYGRSCADFYEGREAGSASFKITSELDAVLAGIVMADPELPHGVNVEHQKLTFTFSRPEYEERYIATRISKMDRITQPSTEQEAA